ncbi:MAG: AMP-binding protein [Bacteroides sp.]|jgi:long-chain acyl-CoA synthetase|nr:AMP-binding protein [Bacteroides sp.]
MEHKSLPQLFETSVKKFPDNVLLWEKKTTEYRGMTYQETYERVLQLAAGFLTLNLEKGDRVALVSEGRNDWVIGELALFYCNAASVPLSVKLEEPGDLIFRISHSGCKGVIVSGNHKQKIFNIIDQLPTVEFILLLDAPEEAIAEPALKDKVVVIDDLIEKGDGYLREHREELEEIKNSIEPDDHANICYTSGTTADPKGIILTHKNYLCNVEQGSAIFDVPSYYTSLHILPWDHSFAHTVGIYALIRNGASLASVKVGRTANETLRNVPICIKEVKPYFLLSVPALAKNFRKNIEKGVRDKGKFAWSLFSFGIKVAYTFNQEGFNKGQGWRIILKPLYSLMDTILFKKIRENFGGRLRFFVGGGALLDIELQRFFYAIGIPMYQGYGLTEASPIISSNTPDFHKLGSSGKVVPWLDLKICSDDGRELPIGEQGEIVIRGDNVMAGYWGNEKATRETIRDGWLYTGDLGYLDKDGYLYVLGRSKSLLIGSDGEKYSPEGIEEAMVEQIPFFDQVMLYNNQNQYTVALVVINKAKLKEFLQKHKLIIDTESGQTAALVKMRAEIDRFMPGGDFGGMFPARWLPAAVAFLDEPFSEQNKLMNSTMKIVRPAIVKYHKETLDYLYSPEGKELLNPKNMEVIAQLS